MKTFNSIEIAKLIARGFEIADGNVLAFKMQGNEYLEVGKNRYGFYAHTETVNDQHNHEHNSLDAALMDLETTSKRVI